MSSSHRLLCSTGLHVWCTESLSKDFNTCGLQRHRGRALAVASSRCTDLAAPTSIGAVLPTRFDCRVWGCCEVRGHSHDRGRPCCHQVNTMRKKTPDGHVERKRPKKWLEPKRRDDVICDTTKVLQSSTLYKANTSPMCTTKKWQTSTSRICHSLSSVWFRLPCPTPPLQDTPATRQKILGDGLVQCHEWRSVFRVFGGFSSLRVSFWLLTGFSLVEGFKLLMFSLVSDWGCSRFYSLGERVPSFLDGGSKSGEK